MRIPNEQPPTDDKPLKEWLSRMIILMNAAIDSGAVPVEVSARGSVGVPVFLQDQTTDILDLPFLADIGTFTITTTMSINSRVFEADPGHGITAGEILELANDEYFMQSEVLSVSSNTIELDTPINHAYTSDGSFFRSSDDMQVDGSVTPVIFAIKPGPGQSGDITGFNLAIEGSSSMDYTKFGSVSGGLTNGCVVRVKKQSGDYKNLFNFKTNGNFIVEALGHYFQEKAGGGQYGFLAQFAIAGQHNRGVAIRLDGDRGEELQVVIQDDLTSGNSQIKMVAYGSELQETL